MLSTLRGASKNTLQAKDKIYHYYSLPLAVKSLSSIIRLLKSLKVLFENLLRWQDGKLVVEEGIHALTGWLKDAHADREIVYRPARVLIQDLTGVPAVVDPATVREVVKYLGGDTAKANPLSPVNLVIDHSMTADRFDDDEASEGNIRLEMERNHECYAFLKWGKQVLSCFSIVPSSTGICHQVNLEYPDKAVWSGLQNDEWVARPGTLVGTDSHATMINGLGMLGWGAGSIEAEAAILGQPVSMFIPDIVGLKLTGKLREGITATDPVLTVIQALRKHGVVGKFVGFYGDGLDLLPLAGRATTANMSPEYSATHGFFPIDTVTLDHMCLSGRSEDQVRLVERYVRAQGTWRNPGGEPIFTGVLELDMNDVEVSLAGPKRPQNRVALPDVSKAFAASSELEMNATHKDHLSVDYVMNGHQYQLPDGAVVITAITPCTNTSNSDVLVAAGLLTKEAVTLGPKQRLWVKASLAPNPKVVSDHLAKTKLTPYLDGLGFSLVGCGRTTRIGSSEPLPSPTETAIEKGDPTVGTVLSGNRNLEDRIHPLVKTS